MRSRRSALALALSLALHVALVIALCLWLKERHQTPERSKPIRIALIPWRSPPKKAEPAPTPKAPPARKGALAAAPTPPKAAAPEPRAATPAPKAAPAPKTGLARAPAPQAAPDAPKVLKLTPDPLPFAASGPAPQEQGGGRTIHNVPGEVEDPKERAARLGREAKEKVDGWIADDLATVRVQDGLVDSWFTDMRKALEKGTAHPPLEGLNFGKQLGEMMKGWQQQAERYAKTGNPYGPDQGGSARSRGTGVDRMEEAWENTAHVRGFGAAGSTGLVAIVELRQDAQGRLVKATLLKSSGNKEFDAYVMKGAPAALAGLPAPSSKAAGVHPDGVRSTWSFEGRVSYKRKLSEMNARQDGLALAWMVPTTLLTGGSFDETTGDIDLVDVAHPQFSTKVTLLKVY